MAMRKGCWVFPSLLRGEDDVKERRAKGGEKVVREDKASSMKVQSLSEIFSIFPACKVDLCFHGISNH